MRTAARVDDPSPLLAATQVEKLKAALLSQDVPPEALQAALAGPLLVPLVRLLADPAEGCREHASAFLAATLPRLPAPGGAASLLPVLVPALAERVGTPPVQEPSEELRLALAELLAGPLLAAAPRPPPPDLLPPLCATLCCQLADPYADIKKVGGCTRRQFLSSCFAPWLAVVRIIPSVASTRPPPAGGLHSGGRAG